jgi:FkbM family methyltransferase
MTFPRLAGRRLNAALGRLGYHLGRVRPDVTTMEAALARAATRVRGSSAGTVIDIGASDGRWSEGARRHFPDAKYLLMEANAVHEPGLRLFKERVARSDYVLAVAGDRVGELHFDASDPFGGTASLTPQAGMITVAATTVDHEVTTRGLPEPFVLKLDTHGFELPILNGASQTLQRTSLLIIEVYNFTLHPGALRFYEMCNHLASLGFRPIDICDPMYRPKDGAFWQCDMFFARDDRPEFQSNSYD